MLSRLSRLCDVVKKCVLRTCESGTPSEWPPEVSCQFLWGTSSFFHCCHLDAKPCIASCLPSREQVQHIFAQLMSGIGRDRTLDAEAQLHPGSSAVARIARQLNVVNGSSYPEGEGGRCMFTMVMQTLQGWGLPPTIRWSEGAGCGDPSLKSM